MKIVGNKAKKTKRKTGTIPEKIFSVCNVTFLLLFAFLCVYPFYYMLIYSFSGADVAAKIALLPKGFTLQNYVKTVQIPGIGSATVVSVSRTVIGTVLTVLCTSFFAYLVTKQNMVGRKFIYRMMIVTMYVGGGLIPTFLVYNLYGLSNNYLVYIIPGLYSAYNVVLVKTFVEQQIPASLEESAMMDGAGPLTCYWKLVLPLSKPILATIAVFSAVGQWNSWFDSHIYITKQKMWSLQYILYRYLQQINYLSKMLNEDHVNIDNFEYYLTPETVRMTITAVVTLPILFVYPFMQRYFMKGIMLGAVKG